MNLPIYGEYVDEQEKKHMKSTGIVRKIDELGRIVIPKEICRTFQIKEDDPMEILTDGDTIIFRQFKTACIFCDSGDDLELFKGKNICQGCLKDLESKQKKTP